MAENGSSGYPQIPAGNWWALRKRFIRSVPANVTGSYLAAVLSMTERSATNNVLRPLKKAGLVDQENKPTERTNRWRDDDQYPQVCEEIRKEVYPQELLDAFPGPDVDRAAVERWFRNSARVGENAARKMARFYLLLVDADPAKQDGTADSKEGSSQPTKSRSRTTSRNNGTSRASRGKTTDRSTDDTQSKETNRQSVSSNGPSLHIDVQVHISPEASPEQIDSIFASMAKHLYKGNKLNGS